MKIQDQVTINSPTDLGNVLRKKRKDQGLTLQEVSDHTGLGVRFISEVERGKERAEIGKVIELCTILGIDLFARSR